MAKLTLDDVTKVYGGRETVEAVSEVSLTVPDGELLVVVGPSGCGKSTTLRMIAGLETVTDGTIEIGGREVQWMAPGRRDVAMVFQSYALYPKMTVRENMGYGLKHSTDLSADERAREVESIAELLEIESLLDDRPAELSGGQKQRVALGRAIVREPDVFLLDEPLSNLDAKLRAHMRTELQRIHDRIGVTTVYVTHDQKEAMTMADRIAILDDGVLQQVAAPETAYDHPTNEFVGTFLGSPSMNVLDARASRVAAGASDVDHYEFAYGDVVLARVPAAAVDADLGDGDAVRFGVRPEDLVLDGDGSADRPTATVSVAEYQGKENFVHLAFEDTELTARVPPGTRPTRGDAVGLAIDPEAVFLFDPETGASIKTFGLDDERQPVEPVD
jgi:multiple sugar transport system ATP-binding protein